jgi:hypothetical protein
VRLERVLVVDDQHPAAHGFARSELRPGLEVSLENSHQGFRRAAARGLDFDESALVLAANEQIRGGAATEQIVEVHSRKPRRGYGRGGWLGAPARVCKRRWRSGGLRFDVVVIDAGRPSNGPAHTIGSLLGAHDLAPLGRLATGRAQLAELPSVRLIEGEATRVDAGRRVTFADETALAARAVVPVPGAVAGDPRALRTENFRFPTDQAW